jgi:ComF family protein
LALGAPRACPACRRRRPILPVRSYARYTGRLVQALLHLKYRPDQKLAAVMGSWLAGVYPVQEWQATRVAPVPLSAARYQQRGFNQAELLARALAARLSLPVERGLRRLWDTRSQVGLDPAERTANVRNAFGADPGAFTGQVVLIVDDLYTTGATIAACARAILAAGAVRAVGLTVGRA